MRDRPFIQANESPRPYSEIRAERSDIGLEHAVLQRIAGLEVDAAAAEDPAEARRLQCEAEDFRCALHELKPRGLR